VKELDLLLYGASLSPFSMRNIIQIAVKDLAIPIADPPGGVHSAEYLAINPLGKIPALVVDGATLPESETIAEFLEDLFPAVPLRPTDAWQRARCRLISRVIDIYVMNPMLPIFAQLNPSTRDDAAVNKVLDDIGRGLDYLDQLIEPGPFAVSHAFTLADCATVPVLKYVERFLPMFGCAQPFAARPRLAAYWAAVQRQPQIPHALAQMEAALRAALGESA
jgi:glutathione S-transferase